MKPIALATAGALLLLCGVLGTDGHGMLTRPISRALRAATNATGAPTTPRKRALPVENDAIR